MKSSIKIDFTNNGRGMEPVLRVKLIKSDDPRDSLLQVFFERLQHKSKWAEIKFTSTGGSATETFTNIEIYPVGPEELPELIAEATQLLPAVPPIPHGLKMCKEPLCLNAISLDAPDYCPDHTKPE